MANYYKDEAGHFTSKENDGGPCKHKRINNGKYEYSEDEGKSWKAFGSRDEYDKYEAKSWDFDENNDDDFGFDEEENRFDRYSDEEINKAKEYQAKMLEETEEPEEAEAVRKMSREEFITNMVDGLGDDDFEDLISEANDSDEEKSELPLHSEVKIKDTITGELKDAKIVGIYDNTFNHKRQYKIEYPDGSIFIKDEDEIINPVDEESSPMNEFSGPEGSELSYAQLDKIGKLGNKEMKLSDAIDLVSKAPTDLQDVLGYVIASNWGLSESEVDKMLTDRYFDTHNHNGEEIKSGSQSMRVPSDEKVLKVDEQKPMTILPEDVEKDPNVTLNYYVKENYPAATVLDFLESTGLKDSGIKGTNSIADVYEQLVKKEQGPNKKEMDLINKEQNQMQQKNKKITDSVNKLKELRAAGKQEEALKYLRELPEDEQNEVLKEFFKK